MSEVARPYIVTVAVPAAHGATEQHSIHLEAYSVQEAMFQACVELEARYAICERGETIRVISVAPDTAAAMQRVVELAKEIGLLRMPAVGSKS